MQLGTHLKSAPDTTLEIFFGVFIFFEGGDVLGTLQDVFKRAQNISKHFHRYELCHLKILLYYLDKTSFAFDLTLSLPGLIKALFLATM